jgi:hypothetical protein
MHNQSFISAKKSYYRSLVFLGLIIILLVVFIIVQLMNPRIVEIPKEVVVEKEVTVEKEPIYTYDITAEEREMLARLVYREANVESIECQMAIVSVVINRWQSGKWGDTLKDVVYAKSQFSPAGILYRTTPNETNYKAVDEVIKNGVTLPSYVLYFRANYHFQWDGYSAYTRIDDTCFGYLTRDI